MSWSVDITQIWSISYLSAGHNGPMNWVSIATKDVWIQQHGRSLIKPYLATAPATKSTASNQDQW